MSEEVADALRKRAEFLDDQYAEQDRAVADYIEAVWDYAQMLYDGTWNMDGDEVFPRLDETRDAALEALVANDDSKSGGESP